jgi:soluble lytic murein transglycosylase-like protein
VKAAFGRRSVTQRLVLRGVGFLAALIAVSAAVGSLTRASNRSGEPYTGTAAVSALGAFRERLDPVRGEIELRSLERERVNGILNLASRFTVPVPLATSIFDAAEAEGLEPELAFRLVKVESNFNPRARSSADALGLAQVQLATARHYDPRITEAQLLDADRNLRIGFRYLRDLTVRYRNDLRMALLAYNVGPSRLNEILEGGRQPTGRYAARVLDGYTYRPRGD